MSTISISQAAAELATLKARVAEHEAYIAANEPPPSSAPDESIDWLAPPPKSLRKRIGEAIHESMRPFLNEDKLMADVAKAEATAVARVMEIIESRNGRCPSP
jgi:hypothetical protein